ncbi:MAG TPA: hypothetical protein VHE30_22025 [Polyangiaceae bacterium]|nr:hypothetical protein [Polyangiaceae bacterium]
MDRASALGLMSRKARSAALRLRLNEILARASLGAVLLLAYVAFALSVVKVTHGAPSAVRGLAWGGAVPLLVWFGLLLHAALRHAPSTRGALALDRHHGLDDRITNALEFAGVSAESRTSLMEAAIEDAARFADAASPPKAVPLRAPRDAPAVLLLLVACGGIALLEVPVERVVPPPPRHVDALLLGADDVELLRRIAEDMTQNTSDPTALSSARRFNQLVEDLAERRLDRREVFRRLDDLARGLESPADLDTSALDEALDDVAKELDKSGLAKPVARALADKRLTDAEHAMEDLAKRVETAKKAVDKQKLEELRKSLEKASQAAAAKSAKATQERSELEERRKRLLKKKENGGLTPSEQAELNRTERRLERLNRDQGRSDAAREGLSGLDKDLAKAASDLMKELGDSAQDLRQSAEDIHRTADRKLSDEQKKEMLRRVEELRQMLRQEGQAGRDRLKRMMAFGQRARGQSGQSSGQGRGQGHGQGGQGKDGQGQTELRLGRGQPGGPGGLVIGPGGASMPGQGSESGGPGSGPGGGGEEWGTGHDENVRGDKTALAGKTEDTTAQAVDTGQGDSTSQVIYGAAERGFVGRGYKKVYADYENVAEEVLGHDEIPPGYRFYVRRYFQLIRPRD